MGSYLFVGQLAVLVHFERAIAVFLSFFAFSISNERQTNEAGTLKHTSQQLTLKSTLVERRSSRMMQQKRSPS